MTCSKSYRDTILTNGKVACGNLETKFPHPYESAITLLLLFLFMSACSTDILRPDTSKVWQQNGMKNKLLL